MAGKVTPEMHAQIVAWHAEGQSYHKIAEQLHLSTTCVSNHVKSDSESEKKLTQKKLDCAQSMLDHMETQRGRACSLLDGMIEAAEKIIGVINEAPEEYGKSLSSVMTSMGILIDKFTMTEAKQPGMRKDNNLFDAIDRSVEGAIDYSDIPEIQPPPETGDDLVGTSGTEQI